MVNFMVSQLYVVYSLPPLYNLLFINKLSLLLQLYTHGLSFAANVESVRMEDPKEQNSLLSVTKSNGEFLWYYNIFFHPCIIYCLLIH